MRDNQEFLQNLYDAFNNREIETIISFMRPDVKWANGVEGGFVYGCDAVREYWNNQFNDIQPELETLKFETDENNRNVVTVHQVIKDLQGNLLADATIQQIFTIEDGLISLYEIGETETIQEMIQKARNLRSTIVMLRLSVLAIAFYFTNYAIPKNQNENSNYRWN